MRRRSRSLTEKSYWFANYKEPLRKLLELVTETEASPDHERHQHISNIASSVEQRAKMPGNEDLHAASIVQPVNIDLPSARRQPRPFEQASQLSPPRHLLPDCVFRFASPGLFWLRFSRHVH